MGGFAQVAGWGVYGATKFAVEGLSEAMQAELSPLRIKVTIVEPGSFRTSFLDGSSLRTTANELPDYAGTAGRVRQAVATSNGGQVNDPAKGAAAIYAAVTAGQPPIRFQVGRGRDGGGQAHPRPRRTRGVAFPRVIHALHRHR